MTIILLIYIASALLAKGLLYWAKKSDPQGYEEGITQGGVLDQKKVETILCVMPGLNTLVLLYTLATGTVEMGWKKKN